MEGSGYNNDVLGISSMLDKIAFLRKALLVIHRGGTFDNFISTKHQKP